MPPRRMRKRFARKRMGLKRTSARPGYSGLNKTYNYTFESSPQWLVSTGTAASGTGPISNVLQITGVGHFLSLANFSNAAGPPVTNVVFPSATGFTNIADFGAGIQFSLNQLQNISAFQSIYDQYKINSVKVTMTILGSQNPLTGLALNPSCYWVVDNDNSAVPAKATDVTGKQGRKLIRFLNKGKTSFSVTVKPKTAVGVYDPTNTAVGYNPAMQGKSGWIDCNESGVEMYGLKLWFQNFYLPGATSSVGIQFDYKWNVSFRGAQNAY